MYGRILVAVDLTEDATSLLAKAQELAALHGASLVLAHVSEPAALSAAMMGPDGLGVVTEDARLDEELVDAAYGKLRDLAAEAGLDQAELKVILGLPSDGLVRLAEETGADLILVGHHSRRGLQWLLGAGTDSGVLHHAPCDVLAVHA